VLAVGRDVFEYAKAEKHMEHPAILKSDDLKAILNSMPFFDFIYFTKYETNVELITSVAKKDKRFMISLADILGKKGFSKSLALYRISRFIEFCISYKADFVICSRAKDIYGVRDPEEIIEICKLLDLEPDVAKKHIELCGV
jgi:RNase P/RNase MRP subunit p30